MSSSYGEMLNGDGVLMISAGGGWPVMNTAFLRRPVTSEADLQNRILLAKRYYGPKKTLWLFIVFNDWLDPSIHAEQLFWNQGISHMQDCMGMQTERLIEPAISGTDLEFRHVETEAGRLEFCDINADSYGFTPKWRDDMALWISQWPLDNLRLYVAYSGNVAVSSSMVYLMGDIAYLGFVATRKEHQRRGYAEAIARYAIAAANENGPISKSILHSTPAGLPLYQSLGYSEVARFGIYLGGSE